METREGAGTVAEFTNPPRTTVQRDFFVPGAEKSIADSLDAWRAFATEAVGGATDRKVQRLVYRHNDETLISEVGYREHDRTATWLVTAIFEPRGPKGPNSPWSICIVRVVNGNLVSRNPPILVSQSNIIEVLDFRMPEAGSGEVDGHGTDSQRQQQLPAWELDFPRLQLRPRSQITGRTDYVDMRSALGAPTPGA